MRVKFSKTVQYESEGRNKGPIYEKDSVHDFPDDFGQKWLRRGVAEVVEGQAPSAAREVAREADGKPPGKREPKASAADLESMTKDDLQAYGESIGADVHQSSQNKDEMIDEVKKAQRRK